jgi:hypothetical protein
MSFLKGLLVIALIIIAVAHFFPNPYDSGREWLSDKIGGATNDKVQSGFDTITDIANEYAEDFRTFECVTNRDCNRQFGIDEGLRCNNDQRCEIDFSLFPERESAGNETEDEQNGP